MGAAPPLPRRPAAPLEAAASRLAPHQVAQPDHPDQDRMPSTMHAPDAVGITRVSLRLAASRSAAYSASVRSRPVTSTNMCRSSHLPKDGSFAGGRTCSTISALQRAGIDATVHLGNATVNDFEKNGSVPTDPRPV